MRTSTIGCALALGLLFPIAGRAQATGRITGVVTSDAGRPVPYAQIAVQSTQFRAITDTAGRFRIVNVPAGQYTVRANALGHTAQDAAAAVTAGGTTTVNITLPILAASLQQVVVVGYGEQRKGEVTGAVASVTSEEFVKGPARDAASVLAGKIPGLGVTTPSGDPRRGSQINLRGVTTIQGSTSPLVIIDGIPGNLETVPATDIEAITVLKDGSAAAVYGSRASNGVILITTKRQQGGKPTLTYDGFASAQTIYRRPDFLSAADYRQLKADGKAFEDLGFDTDWQSQLLRKQPVSQRHNMSLGGGAGGTNYTASLTYDKAQGTFLRSDNQEITARGNIRHAMFDGRLSADLNVVSRTQNYYDDNGAYSGAWRQALIRNPTDRVLADDGNWQERGTYMYTNPLGLIMEQNGKFEGRDQRLHGTMTLRPINALRFSLMGGVSRGSTLRGNSTTFRHVNTTQGGQSGTASRSTASSEDRILEGTGTFTKAFRDHNVTLLGGYGYQDFLDESFNASNFQFPTDLFGYDQLQRGTALTEGRASLGSDKSNYKLIGFFSRLNYDWQNRFLLMGSVRYEGNSRFGAGNKWGVFPAVSAGWRLSEEGFVKRALPFVDDLRLRSGYGVTGIAPDRSYLSLTSYSYGGRFLYNGQWVQGLAPARNPNPNLRWEEKRELNTGLDFSMFSARLSGAVDVYKRDTKNMLYDYSVPVPPYLFNRILANVGTMRNSGVETQLSYDVFRGGRFRWTTNANWSTNRNKLVTLSNETFQPQSDCYTTGATGEPIQVSTHQVCVGQQIGNFFGWKSVDIDDKGEWIVLNKSGQPIPIRQAKPDDRTVLGNGIPKQYAAWNNSLRLGPADFEVNVRGAFGFQILNYLRMYYENPKITQYNMLKSAFDPVYGKRPVNYDLAFVSYYIEDGDYVKLDNATLGYTIPQARLGALAKAVTNARVYVSGRNLLTLTGYKGLDPEVPTNGLTPGQDQRDQYPTTRMFTAGVNVSF
jgi:TonB-dependent starch-binding outer membrane protein SusC